MTADLEEAIARKLGRPLDPSQRGAIRHLNDVPEALIEDARRLAHPMLAQVLLAYYTSPACNEFLKLYVHDVVFHGTPPRTWMRGRVLFPSLSIEEQLRREAPQLLAPLGGVFEVRVVPRLSSWKGGGTWEGAPAVVQPDSDYLTPTPEGTLSLGPSTRTEPVRDPVVAMRRWHASRLAFLAGISGALVRARALEDLSLPSLPVSQWTIDARVAGAALLREQRELGPTSDQVPGFRGPDSWFDSSALIGGGRDAG